MSSSTDRSKFNNTKSSIISSIKKYKYLILIFLLISIFLIGIWHHSNTYQAIDELDQVLNQPNIQVNDYNWIISQPSGQTERGFVIYPGRNVEPEAYLPLAQKMTELGFKSIIVSMPFNLAVFNADAAIEVFYNYPDIKEWYIAGHSLGGVMAAKYADLHPYKINGLILMAAYPQKTNDLSKTDLPVLSLTASKDKILDQQKYQETKRLLPASTRYREIEGGNHSQFGRYGFQEGDGQATITAQKQLEQTVNYIKKLIRSTEKN